MAEPGRGRSKLGRPIQESCAIMTSLRHWLMALSLILAAIIGPLEGPAAAATAAQLNADGHAALQRLYAQSARALRVSKNAHAILVFPKIVKAGLLIGGQGGGGVLFI